MRLSIVIPNFNNGKWLSKCLESITSQTFQDFEIILIDDMSTDDSVEVAKKYLREQDTLIINETKRLNGGSRNIGIMKATGEYIFCIDSDDWLYDNKVFEEIDKALVGQDILFVSYIAHNENYDLMTNLNFKSLNEAFKSMTCAIWTKVVRKEILQKCLFREGTLLEDKEHHYRVLMNSRTYSNLNKVAIVWNRTNTNTLSIGHKDYLETYRFNFCGDLLRLLETIEDEDLKGYVKEELKAFMNTCREMVDKI